MGAGAQRQKNNEMLCFRKLQQCALEGLVPGKIRHWKWSGNGLSTLDWGALEVEDEQGQLWGREGWGGNPGWKSLSTLQVGRALLPCPLLSRTSRWSEQGPTSLSMHRPGTYLQKHWDQTWLTILCSLLKQGFLCLLSDLAGLGWADSGIGHAWTGT